MVKALKNDFPNITTESIIILGLFKGSIGVNYILSDANKTNKDFIIKILNENGIYTKAK